MKECARAWFTEMSCCEGRNGLKGVSLTGGGLFRTDGTVVGDVKLCYGCIHALLSLTM